MAALGTVGAVKALVYDAVFKRAQEIAASEKLRSVVYEGEDLLKGTAECIGSSPSDVYVLSVSIDGATAVGDCSCPAGKSAKSGLCKHAMAFLLRRVQEIQGAKISSWGSPPEEAVISIASQSDDIDDIVTRQGARKSADGIEAIKSTVAQGTGPPASSSKRALPAWMSGVVGSAVGQTQSSNKAKSNKRAAEPKLPRPPPPPTKRARRSGHPLNFSNGSDNEGEDPGEVHDAGPMEKCPAPVVTEDDEVPKTIDLASEGAAARERRRLRALKQEAVVIANDKGNDEVQRTRGRASRSVSKEVKDQPVRAAKRRRLAKKYVDEESDGSENEATPVDADATNGFGLTDEDLLFLAQEHLERDKATGPLEDLRQITPVEPSEDGKQPEKSYQGKKSSSIFSMNRWKAIASEGRSASGATDDLDFETLKSFSLAATCQCASQSEKPSLKEDSSDGVRPSLGIAEPVSTSQDTPISTPISTGYYSTGAAVNNMLNIFFGSSLCQVSPEKVSAAATTTNASKPNYLAAEVEFEAPTTSSSVREVVSVAPTSPEVRRDLADSTTSSSVREVISVAPASPEVRRDLADSTTSSSVREVVSVAPASPEVRRDLTDFGGELKPKKKSSLKDRVKMFLR